jgi:hypothetical protein
MHGSKERLLSDPVAYAHLAYLTKHMIDDRSSDKFAKDLIKRIDEALVLNPLLSDRFLDDINRLKREIITHCQEGETEEANNATKVCLDLIHEGEPVNE